MEKLIKNLGVADVIDAMGMEYDHRAHIIHLKSPDPNKVLFGRAVTIGFMPVRKDFMDSKKHSLAPAFYRAIGQESPVKKVLVMSSGGYQNTSLGGGTKLSRLKNHQMAGVLCDGQLRDFEELNSYEFATYCRGETVRAGGNEILPYLTNVPVVLDGVTVLPGDYVFAKGSTAVIIPAEKVEYILKKSKVIMDKMDEVKTTFIGEDPVKILKQGSSEI
ncbi:RraA family protein [Flagellimonas sp. 2504JD4-2]